MTNTLPGLRISGATIRTIWCRKPGFAIEDHRRWRHRTDNGKPIPPSIEAILFLKTQAPPYIPYLSQAHMQVLYYSLRIFPIKNRRRPPQPLHIVMTAAVRRKIHNERAGCNCEEGPGSLPSNKYLAYPIGLAYVRFHSSIIPPS